MPNVKCKPYYRLLNQPKPGFHIGPRSASEWDAPDAAAAYGMTKVGPGGGVIGIIELGGGWQASDMNAYFAKYNLPVPKITDVPIDLSNSPGGDADVEVALDIQVSAMYHYVTSGRLPQEIKVYWCNAMEQGIAQAMKDGCDAISISWGAPEDQWGDELNAVNAAAAANMAIPVFAASGDNDATDGTNSPITDGPSSCPNVIGCGGTNKPHGSGQETVWNSGGGGTGGGYSKIFPVPAWQVGIPSGAPGRMVPDVAAVADPATGYVIYVQGGWTVVGGTSGVAPAWAGFIAALKLGPTSNVLTALWKNPAVFADITVGNNGTYRAVAGPDPCTGLGVPIGAAIAALFQGAAPPVVPPVPPSPPGVPPVSPVPPPVSPPASPVSGTLSALTGTAVGPLGHTYPVTIPQQSATITPAAAHASPSPLLTQQQWEQLIAALLSWLVTVIPTLGTTAPTVPPASPAA